MMYDERFVTPMRQELTRLGIEELRTAADVDAKLRDSQETTLVVVNPCADAPRETRVPRWRRRCSTPYARAGSSPCSRDRTPTRHARRAST